MQFPFTLATDPGTDLWRIPPSTDDHDAPTISKTKKPLLSWRSASISFSCPYTTQFDQAGIVLTLTHPSAAKPKWIKAGVEFFSGIPRLSVVCCDQYSDWSVSRLPAEVEADVTTGKAPVEIRVEKEDTTVWIHYVDHTGEKVPLREIAWVYGENGGEGWELDVGALVARPNKDVKGQLEATIHSLNDEWSE